MAGIDPAAQHLGHELRAEANSNGRQSLAPPSLDQRDLPGDERIALRLVDPDRPAQDDQEIGVPDAGMGQVVDGRLAERDVPARALHDRSEQAEILERDMAQSNGRSALLKHQAGPLMQSSGGGASLRA